MTIRSHVNSREAAQSLRDLAMVRLPGDAGYERARAAWNASVDQRPAATAVPAHAGQAAAVVRAASAAGLRVAPQCTGHNAAPLRGLADAVLMRTSAMTGVAVDPDARRARAQAGALWQDAVAAAGRMGLAALHGSAPDVGIVGYSLGGGLGWYARSLGLQTNSVTAVELLTADGELVRADDGHESDLFWALRGGGGNFGLVTAVEFALHEVGTPYAGMMAWDWRQAEPVLRRWAQWAPGAPEEITTSLRLLQVPPMPTIPEPFRGRQLVVIDGAALADREEGERILAPLRELSPELDTFAPTDPAALVRLHMDPEEPTPSVSESLLLSEVPAAAIDALLTAAGPGSGSSLLMAELRQLGGALARPHPGGGALPALNGQFLFLALAIAMTPELAAKGAADARRAAAALAPWGCGQYLNFAEAPVDVSHAYREGEWKRLRAIRAQTDPYGLFLANHPVPAA